MNVDSIHTWTVPVPLLPAVDAAQVTASETFDPTIRVVAGMHADEPLLDPLDPPDPLDDPDPLLVLPELEPLDPVNPPELDELPAPLPLPELPPELDEPEPEPLPLLDPPSSGGWT
jgi:hypothetical protein